MKLKVVLLIAVLMIMSCKNDKTTETESSIDYSEENLDVTTTIYPENLNKIFEAHGGLDVWKQKKTLKFTMEKESGQEVTATDLYSRSSLIEMPKHTIGYDGNELWLRKKDTTSYKGNARFYYNLMFYFYAMPFILADDGIIYEDVEPLIFEGKSYPGIKISYENGVGESPDDEYILYYDSETHQMEWLGYTVTYFSKEKSKEFHFIKYSKWQVIDGLQLPRTLTWYNYENNLPTTKRNDLEFINVVLSEKRIPKTVFDRPENAELVE